MFGKFKEKAAAAANEAMQKHLGTVQDLVKKELGPAAKDVLNDDSKMTVVFKHAYILSPAPLRLVVSEDKFVEFCLNNRSVFIAAA